MYHTRNRTEIPIFFATDDNYAPFLGVAIESIMENVSKEYVCKIHVLTTDLSPYNRAAIRRCVKSPATVEFVDVSEQVKTIAHRLHLRDYYTRATYYRFFIANLFPQYDKALYLDCDIVVTGDVAQLYNTELGDNLVGAIQEEVMNTVDVFGTYVEAVMDIPRQAYFNAGVLVMNLKEFRRINIEKEFLKLLEKRKFEVTQDQDYLNVICYKKSVPIWLDWNKTPIENPLYNKNVTPKLVHYKINWKPWHYNGVMYGDLFWKYASKTPYNRRILKMLRNYSDEEKQRDVEAYNNLYNLAEILIADTSPTYCNGNA